jgi:hypothetical protein
MVKSVKRTLRSGGRRQFLKTLSTLGLSGSALQYMSQDALAELTDNPKDEVPRLEALHHTNHEAVVAGEEKPEREPVYYTIPRAEWARTEAAHNASQRLFSRIHRRFGTSCTGDRGLGYVTTAVADRVNGHHREKSIVARHVTFNGDEPQVDVDRLREATPAKMSGSVGQKNYEETVEGIPVTVEKEDFSTMGGGNENYYDYDYSGQGTPCGAQVEVKYGGETADEEEIHFGTVACPGWHDDHGSVMLTAAHVVDDNFEGYENEDIYNPDHPDDPNYPGGTRGNTLKKEWTSSDTNCGNRSNDSAIAKFDDGYSYKFAADDGSYNTGWEVYGTLGWDNIGDGASLTKQGARTGVNYGSTSCVDSNYNVFEIDATSGGGDSGGPIFTETYYEGNTSFKSVAGIVSYGGSGVTGAPHIGNAESAMNVSI